MNTDKKIEKEIIKNMNKTVDTLKSFRHADITFEGGVQKSGYVAITFDCDEALRTYIIFSCSERNERGQLLLYAVSFCPLFSNKWEFEYMDQMVDEEIEMIEDTIAEVSCVGWFHKKQRAILDKNKKVEKVVFK